MIKFQTTRCPKNKVDYSVQALYKAFKQKDFSVDSQHQQIRLEHSPIHLFLGHPLCSLQDFVLGLSILVNGSDEEKLEWTFHLYDLDGDGVISREEMEDLAMAVSSQINCLVFDDDDQAIMFPRKNSSYINDIIYNNIQDIVYR